MTVDFHVTVSGFTFNQFMKRMVVKRVRVFVVEKVSLLMKMFTSLGFIYIGVYGSHLYFP